MNTRSETFSKKERLCSKKIITFLFDEGEALYTPLFRVVWTRTSYNQEHPARAAFSVPKKNIRNAVSRNLMKRRMREAYRHNKHELYDFLNSIKLSIAFIMVFRGTSTKDYGEIEKSIKDIIRKLSDTLIKAGADC